MKRSWRRLQKLGALYMSEERERVDSDASKATLRWLIAVTGRTKAGIFVLTLLRSAISVTTIFFALTLREVIDAATEGERSGFLAAVLLLVGIIIVQIVLQALIRWLEELLRSQTENVLKRRVYETVLTRSYASLAAYHTGELLNRMTSDTAVIADGMVTILPNTVAMLVKICGAAIVLMQLDPRFALVFLIGGAFLLFVTYGLRKIMKRMHKQVQQADGRVRSYLQETIGNLIVLRSYGGEAQAAAQAMERMETHRRERMKRNRFSNISNSGLSAVMYGGYLFGLIWCGFGILDGTVTYGTLTAVLQLVNQIQSPFANMTGYLPKFYAMLASVERLIELEELPSEADGQTISDGTKPPGIRRDVAGRSGFAPDISQLYGTVYLKERMSTAERDALYCRLCRIDFRAVCFAYPEKWAGSAETPAADLSNPPVLTDASFSIRKGEFIAITGRSGIGKSTLLKLLLAMYTPQAGDIRLVCRDGEEYPVSPAVRPLFAYVPQGNFLLSGNVRDAVIFLQPEENSQAAGTEKTLGRREGVGDDIAVQEKVAEACRIACADFIDDLPNGFDTPIGEKGAGLSEGQAQRIAIARAIYSGAPVLLLDESTSALDAQTEEQLLVNIRDLTDRTVLIVTHRKAALAVCDRVIHVEKGNDATALRMQPDQRC